MKSESLKRASQISAIVEGVADKIRESIYDFNRDENYNLYFKMGKGEVVKIPVIDLRLYQLDVQKILFGGISKRILLSWPRRAGKEVVTWNIIVQAAITMPGMYIMAYPTNVRARKILWQGAALINGVSTRFLDMIPKELLARKPNDAEMTVELVNGSLIWIVGCDIDPDKLRGTNPLGIVFSELAFSDPRVLYTMMPVLRQNGGWLIGQSTYDGMNHFWHMLRNNRTDPNWYCREESILTLVDENGKPYITEEDVNEDRAAGMPEYLIQQEYYGNVQINEETKFFAIAINKIYETERIISGMFLPQKTVFPFFDIGVDDCTSITLAQFKSNGSVLCPHIVGYLESNNHDLTYYVDEIRKFCSRYNLPVGDFYVPHDGKNRNWNDKLKNTLDYLRDMGITGHFVERPNSHRVAVEAIRQCLYRTYFNKENTQRLIDCLSSYEKEYDDDMGKFKDNPVHNWASHGVKSYQTLVLALDANLIVEKVYDVIYLNQ